MMLYRDCFLLLATSAAVAILMFNAFTAMWTANTGDKYRPSPRPASYQKAPKSAISKEKSVMEEEKPVIKTRELFQVDQKLLRKARKDKGQFLSKFTL